MVGPSATTESTNRSAQVEWERFTARTTRDWSETSRSKFSRDPRVRTLQLNVHGCAIALGHPIGCTGARIATTLLHALESNDKTVGLATLCISGGMGLSMIVERV